MRVNIYIETDSKSPRKRQRMTAYVLEAIVRGETVTRTAIEETEETYHGATLQAIEKALARIKKTCEVTIHASDAWALAMLKGQLKNWKKSNFLNVKGDPIKDQKRWLHIWCMTENRTIETLVGPHAYTKWMQEEMKKAKEKRR